MPKHDKKGKKNKPPAAAALMPADAKIANRLVSDNRYRGNLLQGFLRGVTFGRYKP